MQEASTSTLIVKKVRRREPDTVADPWRSALVLLALLLTLLLPSDGAGNAHSDDSVASNPYWRPAEITAPARLPPAEDFSYQGLALNEDDQLVLHFEQVSPADETASVTAAAMPVPDPRYYARPYPVPVYIYLPMWHERHYWSYCRLTDGTEAEEADPEDPTKTPEGSVVVPEPSAALLLLLSMLFPALQRRRTGTRPLT